MKKAVSKKLWTIGLLILAVIALVEFQKFMKARCATCTDGRCASPAWKIIDAQQLPLPDGATSVHQGAPLPRLIDFGAGKCVNCKMMNVVLDELRAEYGEQIDIRFVDVWENEEAGKTYSIKLIPTQIFLDAGGKELFRHEGFISKEDILKKWAELGINFISNE